MAFTMLQGHKHKMAYVVKFEQNLRQNLEELCDDLLTRRYKALPSKCFIVYPKKRMCFRDRISSPFRYTHQLRPSLPTVLHSGTHYGIRIRQHIRRHRSTGRNLRHELDIRGYFMHINRETAEDSHRPACMSTQVHARRHRRTPATWADIRDLTSSCGSPRR